MSGVARNKLNTSFHRSTCTGLESKPKHVSYLSINGAHLISETKIETCLGHIVLYQVLDLGGF